MRLTARAPGKFNPCLFVGRVRPEGMHPLVSVIQPVSIADELTLAAAGAGATGDVVRCPGVSGPNLADRALAAYRAAAGWDAGPLALTIAKHVPVAAGMGGGSADAAAALRLAAALRDRPGDAVAAAVAPGLGSDVPAAWLATRCLVAGLGERVVPLPAPAPFGVLVLPSQLRLSTAAVYAQFDALGLGRDESELARLEREIAHADRVDRALPGRLVHNDLQPAALSLCPSIADALRIARDAGADHALMSGSGPTVVGLFHGAHGAERARAAAVAVGGVSPGALAATPVGADFAWPEAA